MLGKRRKPQQTVFIPGTLSDYIPDDHVLKQVNAVLDLGWLREEVRDCYDARIGRASIDPEAALRLMLAGFFQGIVHDRKLIREAEVNLAIRWFARYELGEELPEHSSLTRIRQRWGVERFQRIFQRTVEACIEAGLVSGETVHIDATLIRADVSWESLVQTHTEQVLEENTCEGEESNGGTRGGRKGAKPKPSKPQKISRTDPEASMTTSRCDQRLEPYYKQHTAVDDRAGVVVDVEVTTGQVNEGTKLCEQVERVAAAVGVVPERVTADKSYAHGTNYQAMEALGIDPVIPPQRQGEVKGRFHISRFTYEAEKQMVVCPCGVMMQRSSRGNNGWVYRARASDCRGCAHRTECVPPSAKSRTVTIVDGYESLMRARERIEAGWDEETAEFYNRHRWRVEGAHGEAKTMHGLRRAARRGLVNVAIQAYLAAAVMNLKRLAAAHVLRLLCARMQLIAWSLHQQRQQLLCLHLPPPAWQTR